MDGKSRSWIRMVRRREPDEDRQRTYWMDPKLDPIRRASGPDQEMNPKDIYVNMFGYVY